MHTMHLPQMRKKLVSNYDVLVQAEKTIQTLEAKKQQEELKKPDGCSGSSIRKQCDHSDRRSNAG